MLYSDVIHSFDWKSAIEHDGCVKMRDNVPSARYYSVCNVLLLWNISLIPTYKVYDMHPITAINAISTSVTILGPLIYNQVTNSLVHLSPCVKILVMLSIKTHAYTIII